MGGKHARQVKPAVRVAKVPGCATAAAAEKRHDDDRTVIRHPAGEHGTCEAGCRQANLRAWEKSWCSAIRVVLFAFVLALQRYASPFGFAVLLPVTRTRSPSDDTATASLNVPPGKNGMALVTPGKPWTYRYALWSLWFVGLVLVGVGKLEPTTTLPSAELPLSATGFQVSTEGETNGMKALLEGCPTSKTTPR